MYTFTYMYIYEGRDDGADTGRDAAPPPVIREQRKLLHADHVLMRVSSITSQRV